MMKNVLKTNAGTITFSIEKTLWLYFILIPIFFIDFSKISWLTFILTLIILLITVAFGHTIGLHRGVIHKSYKTSKTFQNFTVYLFTLTGMGSPLSWLKQHYFRDYWQNRNDCPRYFQYQHSIFRDYWWNLHFTFSPNSLERYQIPKEDLQNPWMLWLHKTWYLHSLIPMIVLFILTNFHITVFVMSVRIAAVILAHWYIGFASHKYGYMRYKIRGADESGFNDIFLGLISFGEGFHNNHHSHPTSAKFSAKWYEIDFGWKLILLLRRLRIIHSVNTWDKTLKSSAEMYHTPRWRFPWQ